MTQAACARRCGILCRASYRAFIAVVLLSLTTGLSACSGSAPEVTSGELSSRDVADTLLLGAQALDIAGVTLDTAVARAWRATTVVPARVTLDPDHEQTLGSITEGRVSRVLVRVGDSVRTGQILVAIHSHEIMDARSALSRAEAQQRAAEAESELALSLRDRAERLFAARALSMSELERARAAAVTGAAMLAQANAERIRAEGFVEHLVGEVPLSPGADPHEVLIRAPFAGVVSARQAVPGAVVLPGEPLVAVADVRSLMLELRLADRSDLAVSTGATVSYALVGEPASAPRGEAVVVRVAPMADANTRTRIVQAQITVAAPGTRAERFATATVAGDSAGAVLQVPAAAVQALGADSVVFVSESRGAGMHVRAVPVRIGRRDAMHAEVLAGLDSGAVVVARGAAIVRAEMLRRREADGND